MPTKKSLVVAFALLWCGVGYFVWQGTIDESTFDDQGLLALLHQVPESENGFSVLSYTTHEDYLIIDDGYWELEGYISGEAWDIDAVQLVLSAATKELADVRQANRRPYFSVPSTMEFSHNPLRKINQLLLLETLHAATDSNYEQAIASLGEAFQFSQRVKSEEGATLISWAVGNSMLADCLGVLHRLVTEHALSESQLRALGGLIVIVKPYSEDGLTKVFSGELKFTREYLLSNSQKTLMQRLDAASDLSYWGYSDQPLKSMLYEYAVAFFPAYYEHPVAIANETAKTWRGLKNQQEGYCRDLPLEREDWLMPSPQWLDFFIPNSRLRISRRDTFLMGEYYMRRCHFHVYADAIKTVVALKAFQHSTGSLPEQLSDLVPAYLAEQPIDYFDGGQLNYSKTQRWIYSVGSNFQDDGGSSEGLYTGACYIDACELNPTIALDRMRAAPKASSSCRAKYEDEVPPVDMEQ